MLKNNVFGGLGLYSFFLSFHCIQKSCVYSTANNSIIELISISLFIFEFVEGEFAALVLCCMVQTLVVDLFDENE